MFLFERLKEGVEGELPAAASAAANCNLTAPFTTHGLLLRPPAALLLSFCVLNLRKQTENHEDGD